MKHPAILLPAILAIAASLCSCAPMPRHVPYNEAAFAPYKGAGSGTVSGRAFTVLRDNTVKVAENCDIGLMPDTAYSEEIANRVFTRGKKLQPADPRFTKYVRYGTTDGDGNFVFNQVHPGDYYVFMDLPFHYTDHETDSDGNTTAYRIEDDQWIFAQITVKDGQTTKVNDWAQGK